MLAKGTRGNDMKFEEGKLTRTNGFIRLSRRPLEEQEINSRVPSVYAFSLSCPRPRRHRHLRPHSLSIPPSQVLPERCSQLGHRESGG